MMDNKFKLECDRCGFIHPPVLSNVGWEIPVKNGGFNGQSHRE